MRLVVRWLRLGALLGVCVCACDPKPASSAPASGSASAAAAAAAPASASASASASDTGLQLHPLNEPGSTCARDADCMVTNQVPDCCACCGSPPRGISKADYDRERGVCALMKVKCGDCSNACKPVESADAYRPVCVAGICRAARKMP